MLLFALVLNPLMYTLEGHLTDNGIVQRTTKTAVMPYANEFIIFVTSSADIQIIEDLPLTYKRAMDPRLNIRKSKAMTAGSRDTSMDMMDIPYYQEITVL